MASLLNPSELRGLVAALGAEEALGGMRVRELRDYCRHFCLKMNGLKMELLERLAAYVSSTAALSPFQEAEESKEGGRGTKRASPGSGGERSAKRARGSAEAPESVISPIQEAEEGEEGRGEKRAPPGSGGESSAKRAKGPTNASEAEGEQGGEEQAEEVRPKQAHTLENLFSGAVSSPKIPLDEFVEVEGEHGGEEQAPVRPKQAHTLETLFSGACLARPKIPLDEFVEATRGLGPEGSLALLTALDLLELKHYCLGLGVASAGEQRALVGLLLKRLTVLWEKLAEEEAAEADPVSNELDPTSKDLAPVPETEVEEEDSPIQWVQARLQSAGQEPELEMGEDESSDEEIGTPVYESEGQRSTEAVAGQSS